MIRLEGASAAIRAAFRPWATDVAAGVTAFGGATVLLFALSLWFWVGDRRKIATVVSYAFVALSIVLVLKTVFGLPRPPAELSTVRIDNDPYGFPSGHAVAAVVVYGGLATVYGRRDARTLGVVATVVTLIALSRIVIGVHYLGDVVAGLLLGTILLVTLWHAVGRNPTTGFAVAVGVGAIAMALGTPERAMAFGGAVGGLVGSLALDRLKHPRSRFDRAAPAVIGVPVLIAGTEVIDALESTGTVVLANAVLVAVIFVLPVATGMLPMAPGDTSDRDSGTDPTEE